MWLQFIDGGMWRAVAHFAIATVLGWVVFAAAATFATGIAAAFSPLYASGATVRIAGFPVTTTFAPVFGVAAALLSLALIFGLALLHGALSRVLIAPIREAQLAAVARDASASAPGSSAICTTASSPVWSRSA
jgi:hypothetical protein